MFSAPGTCNVQCPWHYNLLHCAVYYIPSSGFWCDLSFSGFQPISGMIWEPPIWLWDPSLSSPSPWEWSGYQLHWDSVPCCWMGRVLLLTSGVQWNDPLPTVSLSAALHVSCIYYSSFLECSWFSYVFLSWPLASQHVLADGDVDVDVAVLSGEKASIVIKQLDGVSVSTRISPPAMSPTLGVRIWLLWVYHPIQEGWLMHWAHGSRQTTQQTHMIWNI